MSIDIYVRLVHPVSLFLLLPKAANVLVEMLGLSSTPQLILETLDCGRRESAATDELRDQSSPLFLISIAGEPETVSLTVPGEYVYMIMGAQRTCLEYALGAAIAIAFANEMGEPVGDDWQFFSDEIQILPGKLLRLLTVSGGGRNPREAAEYLSGGLGRHTRTAGATIS